MALEAKEGCCQECVMGAPMYIPCSKPATHNVTFKSGETSVQCAMCTDHSVHNRGATATEIKED